MPTTRIPVTETETAKLMKVSNGRVLPLTFGSKVCLEAEKAPWAVTLLAEWRGIAFTAGAGI